MLALKFFVHLFGPALLVVIIGPWDSGPNQNVIVRLFVLAHNFVSKLPFLQLLVKVQ